MIQETQTGEVHVECTLKFKGNVTATLFDGMTIEEIIHDIIHCGDYEYEVIKGDYIIDNVETYDA